MLWSRRLALLSLFPLALVLPARAATALKPDLATRRQAFDFVWGRVRDRHYDPKLGGVDWNATRKRYEPRALHAPTDAAFYATLNAMLGELKQSHFAVSPPELDAADDSQGNAGDGETGLLVQTVEGQPTITRVEPRSGAADAGLLPGLVVTEVDGKPVTELLARVRARAGTRKLRPVEEDLRLSWTIAGRLRGPEGSHALIRYRDEENRPKSASVLRKRPPGETVTFGELPPIPAEVESRRLEGGIGYVRFNIFLMPLMERIRSAVESFRDAPGIIIDVRENPGGLGMMASAVARLLFDHQTNLGTMKLRTGALSFPVFPDTHPYTGPVVIVTDEGSLSTSEIFAGSMQEAGRAVVVGRPTGGMVLPSQIERLPGGGHFQYVIADFRTPKGVLLEGKGVKPDVPVTLTRRELLTGKDLILEKAVSVIMEHPRTSFRGGERTVSAPVRNDGRSASSGGEKTSTQGGKR